MADFTSMRNVHLAAETNRDLKTIKLIATCRIHFHDMSLCLSRVCPDAANKLYMLNILVYPVDFGVVGQSMALTSIVWNLPLELPTSGDVADFRFEKTFAGGGVLNEDIGTDEIRAEFTLLNTFADTSDYWWSEVVTGIF